VDKRLVSIVAGLGAALVVAGGAIAYAESNDGEGRLSGAEADRARAAALKATGGGTANAVERDGEGGHGAVWEVEITKKDGSTVDVRLDAKYQLVTIDGGS
jgi:uncharacterized membrane protein YkoI